MKKLKEFIRRYPYALLFAYWPFYGIWYSVLQAITMERDPYPLVCGLDMEIPFCEWLIIPYVLWYLQLLGVGIYSFLYNPKGFIRLCLLVTGGTTFCLIVCTLFPMYFDRTGMVLYYNDNLLTDLVRFLQGFDPPTTVMPSMHVYVTLALHIGLCKDEYARKNKLLLACSLVYSLTVCLATVVTKQHSILDVGASVLLISVMYFVAYVPKYKRLMRLATEPVLV